METYVQNLRTEREKEAQELRNVHIDRELLDADETLATENPIVEAQAANEEQFYLLCGFSVLDFTTLFEMTEHVIYVPKRGRKRIVGPKDALFLFFHWLRSASPISQIAIAFELKQATLYNHLQKVANSIRHVLVERLINAQWERQLTSGEKFSQCGLVVDATVQKRGRPVGDFAAAKAYFSGKHWIYCLKSQVVTNRDGIAVCVCAGAPGALHDLTVFRETEADIANMVRQKPGEPTAILADKGYIDNAHTGPLVLVTPHKKPPNGILSIKQVNWNHDLASARVVVENYFGRLCTKFRIMVQRWQFDEAYYKTIFEICCALANFDIQQGSGGRLRRTESVAYERQLTSVCQKGRERIRRSVERARRRKFGTVHERAAQAEEDHAHAHDPEEDETDLAAVSDETDDD